ncbi:hypothetical protein HaLaN_26990, partial [Haematococcus lacustris]
MVNLTLDDQHGGIIELNEVSASALAGHYTLHCTTSISVGGYISWTAGVLDPAVCVCVSSAQNRLRPCWVHLANVRLRPWES